MSAQNLEFVLAVANHFDLERKSVKGADGKSSGWIKISSMLSSNV